MSSKGRPYRTLEFEDCEILIGKSARDNDQLSLRIAAPRDLWLHVASGVPGSHVVVRNPDNVELPKTVIQRAAELAAWYSKARNAKRVEVHYCRAADVSKERGAPAGQVRLRKWKSIKVSPRGLDEGED